MRNLSYRLFAATLLSSSLLMPITATAADPGTYRPGTAYNSITAGNADICESQCSGDAQCRSWNYIKISRQAQTIQGQEGVCEFNDTLSSPVPSSVSISGENATRRGSTKLVAGRTNTVRVGAPSMTQAKPTISRPSSTRRVVREAVQERIRPRTTAYQAPRQQVPHQQVQRQQAMQHKMQQPRFRHNLDEPSAPRTAPNRTAMRPQAPQYAAPRGSNPYNEADPRLKQRLQQASRGQATPSRPSQNGGISPLSAPPGVPPMAANSKYAQQLPSASARPPARPSGPSLAGRPSRQALAPQARTAQRPPQAARPQARRVNIPSELSPRPMGTEPSLFGSLYDDVKIPRPLDPAIAADEGAPIPTVLSVPVGPVEITALPPLY